MGVDWPNLALLSSTIASNPPLVARLVRSASIRVQYVPPCARKTTDEFGSKPVRRVPFRRLILETILRGVVPLQHVLDAFGNQFVKRRRLAGSPEAVTRRDKYQPGVGLIRNADGQRAGRGAVDDVETPAQRPACV